MPLVFQAGWFFPGVLEEPSVWDGGKEQAHEICFQEGSGTRPSVQGGGGPGEAAARPSPLAAGFGSAQWPTGQSVHGNVLIFLSPPSCTCCEWDTKGPGRGHGPLFRGWAVSSAGHSNELLVFLEDSL